MEHTRAEQPDPVNHPPHYQVGGLECIDVIEALDLPFHLGNTLKYLWRAGRKDGTHTLEDLKKARFYLDRQISLLEKQ
jgi:hypothetical protein